MNKIFPFLPSYTLRILCSSIQFFDSRTRRIEPPDENAGSPKNPDERGVDTGHDPYGGNDEILPATGAHANYILDTASGVFLWAEQSTETIGRRGAPNDVWGFLARGDRISDCSTPAGLPAEHESRAELRSSAGAIRAILPWELWGANWGTEDWANRARDPEFSYIPQTAELAGRKCEF